MAGGVVDIRDVLLEAQAEVAEALAEIFVELGQPAMMDQVKLRWATMTPEVKEQFKQEMPVEYGALMSALEE